MKVFLSYAPRDEELAHQVLDSLRQNGLTVVNPESDLAPGQNFALAIGRALETAQAMVVLISPSSMASPWVRWEIDYALSNPRFKGRLLPVLVRKTHEFPWIFKTMKLLRIDEAPEKKAHLIARALKRSSKAA